MTMGSAIPTIYHTIQKPLGEKSMASWRFTPGTRLEKTPCEDTILQDEVYVLNQHLRYGAVFPTGRPHGFGNQRQSVSTPTHTWWPMWRMCASCPCNFRLYDLDILVFRVDILSRKHSKNSTKIKLKPSHIIWDLHGSKPQAQKVIPMEVEPLL